MPKHIKKIGSIGLSSSEAILIGAFIRLLDMAMNPDCSWKLDRTGPFDVVFADVQVTSADLLAHTRSGAQVYRVLPSGHTSEEDGTLKRPIRFDHVRDLLIQADIAFSMAAPNTDSPNSFDAANKLSFADHSFKLKRWPPSYILFNRLDLIRAATMLSRRTLTASELSALAELPIEQSYEFLQALANDGILVSTKNEQQTKQDIVARANPRLSFGRALLNGIRQRLSKR